MTEEVIEKTLEGAWYCFPCKQPILVTLTCIDKDKYRIQGDCPEQHYIDLVFTGEIKFLTKMDLRAIAEMYLHVQLDDVAQTDDPSKKMKAHDIYRDHVVSAMFALTGRTEKDKTVTGLNRNECEAIVGKTIIDGSVIQSIKPVQEKIKKGRDVMVQQVELEEEE